MASVVLDAHALLVYLEREEGFEIVRDHLTEALENGGRLAMTTVNVGEVLYVVRRELGDERADEIDRVIDSLPIEIMDVGMELTRIAARFKARGGISYSDCFAAALAFREDVSVITGDREFEVVEDEVKIEWLG